MTAYALIYLLSASCAASASFGDVTLWWSPHEKRLYLHKQKPTNDAEKVESHD